MMDMVVSQDFETGTITFQISVTQTGIENVDVDTMIKLNNLSNDAPLSERIKMLATLAKSLEVADG